MRIITGTLKGRKIPVPPNVRLRPTSDRTKEGIFSVIDARKSFFETHVLDLFAGTGSLGFEALSRGASRVTFVESSHKALSGIENTARLFGVEEKVSIVGLHVEKFLERREASFDFIFADPPYEIAFLRALPDLILSGAWLNRDGWFILEHDKRHSFIDHPHCFFSRSYGRTIVSIFSIPSERPVNTGHPQ